MHQSDGRRLLVLGVGGRRYTTHANAHAQRLINLKKYAEQNERDFLIIDYGLEFSTHQSFSMVEKGRNSYTSLP